MDDKELFGRLIAMLHIGALQQMGLVENPYINKKGINLDVAKNSIDTLDMLGRRLSLSEDEESVLQNVLYDLRLRYAAAVEFEGQSD